MKLVRYGPTGREQPGLIDAQGHLRSLRGVVPDIGPEVYSPKGQRMLRKLDISALSRVAGQPRLGVPFVGIGKFIAIGLNYRDHAAEARQAIPAEPIVFNKWTTCITGPFDTLEHPPHSTRMDWEVELGVVIGLEARYVSVAAALGHVAGYCTVHDISERQFQFERGSQWDKSKGLDSFGPVGPWLVTADEVPDPQALALHLDVNGQRMQSGNTCDMIFSVAQIVSYLSHFMTLRPGDLIATGTPSGVGMGQKPPRYLQPGDTVALEVQGLGSQRQAVVASKHRIAADAASLVPSPKT
jgi:2-keto-4-pentenoate hydratase/2-oxohepta-3-ene-1,7-dioic acid hydratase in catechol pathway